MAMFREIDVRHLGRDRVICAYESDGVIVDPGPESCLDSLLEGLAGREPRALLLTHIHLDHAGAAGALVRRFPRLQVYVHRRGARHLADPSKLVASAEQLYGDEMERLWGAVVPVPEANLNPLSGGETVEGCRVEYTPGHASHHVAYLHEETGDAYVGDVCGVRIPAADFAMAPTPPPDIDLDAWQASLVTVDAWQPRRLCLTHFGRVQNVEAHLKRIRDRLAACGELARERDEEGFVSQVRADVEEAVADEDTAERYFQAAPPEQCYLGLDRYWSKRAETVEQR